MKISKLFFLLFLCGISFHLTAQEQVSFPITGTYKVNDDVKRDFNKVVINANGYSVLMNDKIIRTYTLLNKKQDGSYTVEEYFTGPGSEKKDRPRFSLRLDKKSNNECFISIIYGNRTEKIQLIKI